MVETTRLVDQPRRDENKGRNSSSKETSTTRNERIVSSEDQERPPRHQELSPETPLVELYISRPLRPILLLPPSPTTTQGGIAALLQAALQQS
jgi:hypothetical protein